jgi:hypothetical protein
MKLVGAFAASPPLPKDKPPCKFIVYPAGRGPLYRVDNGPCVASPDFTVKVVEPVGLYLPKMLR